MATESEILQACLRGKQDAWDVLFDAHYAPTARFIFQLGYELTVEDVEEVCQETFLSVIKNLRSFQGTSQFQTWVFKIALNKTRDYREKQLAAKRGGGKLPISLNAENPETGLRLDPPTTEPGPDDAILNEERAEMLVRALDELGDPCREIIQLRYFADLSYEEISKSLALNVKTVSSRLSKCLDKLESIARSLFAESTGRHFPSNS